MASQSTVENTEKAIWGGGNEPLGASYGKLMMWFFLVSDALTFSAFLVGYGAYRFKFGELWPDPDAVFTHFPGLHGEFPLLYVALMTFILIMSSVTMVMAVNEGHKMNQKGVTYWLLATIVGGAIFLGSQAWEWYHFIVGEHGAVRFEDGRMAKVADADGHVLSLHDIIHGKEATHDHHEKFNIEQVRDAFGADNSLQLLLPGKERELISYKESISLLQNSYVVQGANMKENEYGHPLFANFFFFITGFHGFHVFTGVLLNFIIFLNVTKGTYERRGHYEMVEKVGLYWHFVDLVWVFVFTFFYLV